MTKILGLEDNEVSSQMVRAYIKELRDHINALQYQVDVLRRESEDLREYNKELREAYGKGSKEL